MFAELGGKPILRHCIENALRSASYLNCAPKRDITAEVKVLCPFDDKIRESFSELVEIVEGSPTDCFSRYYDAMIIGEYEYICRLTADNPMVPPYIISGMVQRAVRTGIDYVENCDPEQRTHPDGWDVQVVSRNAMNWLSKHIKDDRDREHVCTLLHSKKDHCLTTHHVAGHLPLYNTPWAIKLSVDTIEDLELVREVYQSKASRLYLDPDKRPSIV